MIRGYHEDGTQTGLDGVRKFETGHARCRDGTVLVSIVAGMNQWHVECQNTSGHERTLVVSVDESHRVVLDFPPDESPALTIANVLHLSGVLASALTALLPTVSEGV